MWKKLPLSGDPDSIFSHLQRGTERAKIADVQTLLSLLKCSLSAIALFALGMTIAETATVSQGFTADGWTVLTLPLPFGALVSLLCLSGATAAANAEV